MKPVMKATSMLKIGELCSTGTLMPRQKNATISKTDIRTMHATFRSMAY